MKSLFTALFFIPVLCFGQHKKDSKIIVAVSDTANLITKISTVLYDNDYVIEKRDEQFILTQGKPLDKWPGSLKIKCLIKNNTIILSGLCNVPLIDKSDFAVEYKGVKGSVMMTAWAEIDKIAKLLGTVTYSK